MKSDMFKSIVISVCCIILFLTGCKKLKPEENAGVYYKDKVVILMYHHIDDEESGVTVSEKRFYEHMDMLEENNYKVISLYDLDEFLKGEKQLPANAVMLTFDDGYRSVYEYAFPILKEKMMPATVFMIVKHIGAEEGQIPKITREQMEEMLEHNISFQSHSYNSHFYHVIDDKGNTDAALASKKYIEIEERVESQKEYEGRVFNDLLESITVLEGITKNETVIFAAPYGRINESIKKISNDIGFKYILSTVPGYVSRKSDPMFLNRINAGTRELSAQDLHNLIQGYIK